ncbi:hypothetical protein DXG01_001687 [Tephrocybe rancida]|nr:hypothetical protein DXG01_001687 [Tephrocybe rancida]
MSESKLHNLQDASFSTTFNAPDADVIFRSADKKLYRIHTNLLEFASDGFPPVEFKPGATEVVDLSEDSTTLEMMFRFVYPRLTPSLENIEIADLVRLAEAVEKYQIHAGMQMCKTMLSSDVPRSAQV